MSLSKILIILFWIQSTCEDLEKMWLCGLDIAYIVTPILHKGEQKYHVFIPRVLQTLLFPPPLLYAFNSSWGVTESRLILTANIWILVVFNIFLLDIIKLL